MTETVGVWALSSDALTAVLSSNAVDPGPMVFKNDLYIQSTLEATQGQILIESPTAAAYSR